MRWLPGLLLMALLAALPAAAQAPVTGFLDKAAKVGANSYPYVVYVPRDYTPTQSLPVILFLHGSGERGTDGLKQSQVGLGGAVRMHPERYHALVVMPQCAPNARWDGEMVDFALQALNDVVKEYHGDKDRLYLTGLSLGGYGSWNIAAQHPDMFAAVVPVCGGGKPENAAKLKNLPIWVFHGAADPTVPVVRSQEMVEALKAAGSTLVKYTEYPGVGHNSWDNAYNEAELPVWLFAQKRSR